MTEFCAETRLVRPYAISGGRTHGRREYGPGVLVSIDSTPCASAALRSELQEVVRLCRTPCTVSELATEMAVPLGVADVLIDDLYNRGLIAADSYEGEYGRHRRDLPYVA